MSFNFSIGVVPNIQASEMLGRALDSQTVSFDEVAPPLVGVAQLGEHVVLLDPAMFQADELVAAWSDASGRPGYTVTFSGVADTYVVQAFGPESRLRVRSEGQQVEDEGDALPGEAEADAAGEFEEDRHTALLEKLLGQSMATVFAARYSLLGSA